MVIVTRACDVQLHMICGGEAVIVGSLLGEAAVPLPLPCGCLCHVDTSAADDDLEQLLGGPQ